MMPSKTKSTKSSGRSRSRSTSRSRQRSTSRTRQSSRTRRSATPSSSVSGDSDVRTSRKDTKKSVTKSASKKETKPNDLQKQDTDILKSSQESGKVEKTIVKETVTTTRRSVTRKREADEKDDDDEDDDDTEPTVRMTRGRERREKEALMGSGSTTTTTTSVTSVQSTEAVDSKAVPRTKETILGGPIVCTLLLLIIPGLSLYLSLMCTKKSCVPRVITFPNRLASYLDVKTFGIVIAWVLYQALLCLLPCGRVQKGLYNRNGVRLNYRCNGFLGFLITLFLLLLMVIGHIRLPERIPSPTYVADHFLALQTSALVLAGLTGVIVYIIARIRCRSRDLNPVGNTGNILYDAFVGHELHPRVFGGLDLKFFTCSRLSSMSMGVVALLLCLKEYERRGGWASGAPVNMPLLLVTIQQLLHVADGLFFEESIITSYSMHQDGFGLLHCLTRMVWIPFITTMPVRYLSYLPLKDAPQWPSYAYAGVIMLHLIAFVIRRGSDSQKADFRREPNHPAFSSLETFPTSTSKRLLAGGWWGIVRHPNYLGELLLCISWTLPVGLHMSTPWLVPILLLFTCMVRIRMVEGYCARRHGSGWQKYCSKVRSRLIPYIL